MSKKIKIADLPEFDMAEHLPDEQAVAEYLTVVLEENDPAALADARIDAQGRVALGPLRFAPREAMAPGPAKVAVRPEAWRIGAPDGDGLPATLVRQAYLGSHQELGFDTPLGPVFVVSSEADPGWAPGTRVSLSLAQRGVSVVAA